MPSASHSARRSQTVLTAAALAGLGLLPSIARAADIHWNVLEGDWDTATNWNPATVPGNADRGIIDLAGGGNANVTTNTADVLGVSISNGNSITVQFTGDLTTLDAEPDPNIRNDNPANGIHIGDGGAGSATVAGSGRIATSNGDYGATLTVGRGGGTGSLIVNGDVPTDVSPANVDVNDLHIGGTELPAGGGGSTGHGTMTINEGKVVARAWAFVGRDVGAGGASTGTLNMNGGTFTSNGQFSVGFNGGQGTVVQSGGAISATSGGDGKVVVGDGGGSVGTYNISGGSVRSANDLLIGNNGGTAVVTQTGGTVTQGGGWAFVGANGATGTYNLNGGEFITNGDTQFGYQNTGGGSGTVNHTAGTFSNTGGWSFIGKRGGDGHYNLSGTGEMKIAGALNVAFTDPTSGFFGTTKGTLNQTGGTATINDQMNVGLDPGAVGVVNQDAGTLSIGSMLHVGRGGGTGTYNLTGGTLIVGHNPTADIGHPDDRDLIVGADNGTNGLLKQTGGTISVTKWAFVGRAGNSGGGNGTYEQSGGTFNTKGWLRVGEQAGAVGLYKLSGGEANIGGGDGDLGDDDLIIAVDRATGTMELSGTGVLNLKRDAVLGMNGGNGTYTQSGGDANITAAAFVGHSGTSGGALGRGTFTVSGGTTDIGLNLVLGLGAPVDYDPDPLVEVLGPTNVSGVVNIEGAADIKVAGNTIVGEANFESPTLGASTATGLVNHIGGSLTTGGLVIAADTVGTTAGTYNLSGGTLLALSTTNNDQFNASGSGTATLGPVGGTGVMTVADTATVKADHVRQSSLTMTGGRVTITETGNGASSGTSVINDYTLSGDARYDLKDNKLLTNKSVGTWDGTKYTGVQGDVAASYNFGAWDLPGITTSKPDAGPTVGKATIGVATGEQALFLAPTETGVFGGQTITGTTAIAMYTWAGDVDLNGYVDAVDYGTIDQWIQFPGTTGYTNGDLNYDGVIDAVDYGIIDNGIQLQGAPMDTGTTPSPAALAGGVTAVPEPATLSIVGLATAALLARRRRSR